MANILAHIHVNESRRAEFERIVSDLYRKTWEREPGCVRYEFWRGAEVGKYYCLMCFVDYNAFLDHQVSDHHQEIVGFAKAFDRVVLEWVDPVPGASELGRNHPQQFPDGISELKRRYTMTHPMQLQKWWETVSSES